MSVKVFGDSFSATHKYPHIDNHWSTIVGRVLKEEVINHGRLGATNQYILNTISKNIPNFTESDYVFIQLSGESRVPVIGVPHLSFFPDQDYFLDVTNDTKHDLIKKERNVIMDLYKKYYLTHGILVHDEVVNTIIELANFISTKVKKVILWNLTTLSGLSDIYHNLNKKTKAGTTYSDLWTKSSCGGNKGWGEIMMENRVNISDKDSHPHPIHGNIFIAKEFIDQIIKPKII